MILYLAAFNYQVLANAADKLKIVANGHHRRCLL